MKPVQQGPVSMEEIKNVYDHSTVHCAVVTDSANKILYASQSFADALGYKLNELDGMEFWVTPADEEQPVLDNGISTWAEVPSKKGYVIQKNGSKAMVDYESVSVENLDTEQCTLNRISNLEGYVQHKHLNRCKDTLEKILDNLTASILVIDPELIVLESNLAFLQTFELAETPENKTALKNINCSFWQDEDVLYRLKDNYEQQHYNFDTELDWVKENGNNKSFKIVSRLIHKDDDNNGSKILIVITDITEEKANQAGRNQQIRHIMHELRNPLSNLSLCIELLADSTRENNQEDTDVFLTKASNSVQRMKQLINELNGAK